MLQSPRSLYRVISIAEAITWTLLIAGMIMKYVLNMGGLPVRIGGSIHGLVFLTYVATAIVVGWNQRWTLGQIATAVATAIVPYATIPYDRSIDAKGRLDGPWRTEPTDHPKDAGWFDSTMRWFLKRPALFIVTLVVLVGVVMTVLLILGPPGGRS